MVFIIFYNCIIDVTIFDCYVFSFIASIYQLDWRMTGFRVQKKACSTCIYRKDSPLDLKKLEKDVADKYGGFKGHRVCHHSKDACCRGFWNRHKDKFQMGQIAQRLGIVEFVNVDLMRKK